MDVALNSRELAVVIWLGIGLVWAMAVPDMRSSIWAVVRAFAHPKILGSVAALVAYAGGLVLLGARLGAWDWTLLNDTVLWFLTSALVLLVNSGELAEDRRRLWRAARQALGITVLVEAFVNLFVLPLAVEVILFPVLLFLSMALAVAEGEDEYAPAERVFSSVLALIGGLIFAFVAVQLAGLSGPDWAHVFRALMLPLWLTFGALPLIYLVGLVDVWERRVLMRRLRQRAA